MAYKKSYKKKSYKSKPATWRSLAGRALSAGANTGIKILKKKLGLNTESKFLDTVQSATCTSSLVALASPFIIPQGDGVGNRQGAGIRLTRWKVNATVVANVSSTLTQAVRMVGYYQPMGLTGTQVTPTNILQSVSDFRSHYNMNTEGYRILFDKIVYVDPIGVGRSIQNVEFDYAPMDHQIKWTNANIDGAATDVTAGFFALALMSVTGVNPPTVDIRNRVHFVDN